MPEITDLPRINACLNGLCGLLLVTGWWLIRKKRVQAHRVVMLAAVCVSALFLSSYLYYHFNAGALTRFQRTGLIRGVYLTILLTHTVLATAVLPLVLKTLYHAGRGQFERHRKIARWTMPIWLYVSVTGVLVYLMLYELFPGPPPGA